MVGGASSSKGFKMSDTENKDALGEELETLPENDGPALPPGMTPEMNALLNVIKEKGTDVAQFIGVLEITNQVEEGELHPYDPELLNEAAVLFKIAFAKLGEAVGGSFA